MKSVKIAREITLDRHGIRIIIRSDVLRVKRDAPPLGAMIPFSLVCLFLLVWVYLSIRVLFSSFVNLVKVVAPCTESLATCLFLIGVIILALMWISVVLFDFLLPSTNDINIKTGELTIWKGFIRRRVWIENGTKLSVVVLSPPRAAWGYRIDLINRGKKYNLVPFVCVGSRRKSIVKGEATAGLIMSLIPCLIKADTKCPHEDGVLSIRRLGHLLGLR